jgi:hypothetical protein
MVLAALLAATTAVPPIAVAHPSYSSPCSGCHGGPKVAVSAAISSQTTTTVTYKVSAATATAIAVFNAGSKTATIIGTSGSVTVPRGKTYDIFAVKGPSTSTGLGHASVSPAAAPAAPLKTTTTLVAPKSAVVKTWLAVTGAVTAPGGAAPGKVTIKKLRLVGKVWKTIGSVKVKLVKGAYNYRFKPAQKGSWRIITTYTGATSGGKTYAPSASPTSTVTVS